MDAPVLFPSRNIQFRSILHRTIVVDWEQRVDLDHLHSELPAREGEFIYGGQIIITSIMRVKLDVNK